MSQDHLDTPSSDGATRQNRTGFDKGLASRAWFRLVRYGFRLLYNELAWTYDPVSWLVSLGQWREWQKAGIRHLQGNRVLELAHGPGHMLIALEEAGFEVIGLDFSPYMGRMARRRLQQSRTEAGLVQGKAQALPFISEAFDSILATFPTDFIVDEASIASIYRTLRPGGRLVIVPEARLTGTGPPYRFIDWLFTITGQHPTSSNARHSETPWPNSARKFESAGFDLQLVPAVLKGSEVVVIIGHKSV